MGIILLVGPKHSGKTSAGRALAGVCAGGFADLDEIIEERSGKSPRALYREGSGVFRKAEAEALKALLERGMADGKILAAAAGGGLIDNGEALALLEKQSGVTVVYLDVSAETAWKRICLSAETGGLPPFLDTANPEETHRLLHTGRAAAYRKFAGLIVNAENKSPEDIASGIVKILDMFSNPGSY
ncbi:MAG: shikimate kinase [Treponema sp.]|jgi:shikimate kinase|nr:shikimate kinase [Treponema sp.]